MAAKSLERSVERLMVNQVGVIRTYLPVHAQLPSSASTCTPKPTSKREIRARRRLEQGKPTGSSLRCYATVELCLEIINTTEAGQQQHHERSSFAGQLDGDISAKSNEICEDVTSQYTN